MPPSFERSSVTSPANGTSTLSRFVNSGRSAASVDGCRPRTDDLTVSDRPVAPSLSSVTNVMLHGPLGEAMVAEPEITLRRLRCSRSTEISGTVPTGLATRPVDHQSRVAHADLSQEGHCIQPLPGARCRLREHLDNVDLARGRQLGRGAIDTRGVDLLRGRRSSATAGSGGVAPSPPPGEKLKARRPSSDMPMASSGSIRSTREGTNRNDCSAEAESSTAAIGAEAITSPPASEIFKLRS